MFVALFSNIKIDMRHFSLIISITFTLFIQGQQAIRYIDENVGTVEFYRSGFPLSSPIIDLNSNDNLELIFDILDGKMEKYYYDIRLFNYDWTPVNLDPREYIDGFPDNILDAFSQSINTTYNYVQYRLSIPNDDIAILLPGNYVVSVFKDYDRTDTILSRSFIVYDENVTVIPEFDRFQSNIYRDKQEIHATVTPVDLNFYDLSGNILLQVIQNNNWSEIRTYDKYTNTGGEKFLFNTSGQIVFDGQNEFRIFDIKSLKFLSERVDYINFEPPYYHVYLKPDRVRGSKDYFTSEDLNGMFYIENQESNDEDQLDADYVYVHFTLDAGGPVGIDVFLDAAFTGWKLDKNYMEYDVDSRVYRKTLLLKQGLYNYRYITYDNYSKKIEHDIVEGNYYETDNQYLLLVYYKPLGEVYYLPVGLATFNTKQ